MKSKTLFALLLPLTLIGTACGHKPGEKGRHAGHVVFVDNKPRGWLGVSIDDVTPKLARKKNLKVEEGVYVTNVEGDSPAERADLREGDVIVEYDGKKIYDNNDLIDEVRKTKPGSEVSINIVRDGDKKTLKATVGKMPREPRVFSFNVPPVPRIHVEPRISIHKESMTYGLMLQELNRQLGEYFGAPGGRGLLVKNVKRNSDAEKAGFKAGDVIVKVGKKAIEDFDDYRRALDDFKQGEKADIEVLRKGKTEKLTITIDERERDLSIHHFDSDDDVIIDLLPPEGGARFRKEAEHLKREMEKMKDDLHDGIIDLKNKLQKEIGRIRESINV